MNEKNQFFFLAFLGIILSLFIFYNLAFQTLGSKPKEIPPRSAKPTPAEKKAAVKLTLSPNQATLYSGEILEVRVLAESQEKLIATDIELVFDPRILAFKEVKPGIFWSKPQQLAKVINNQKGEILYSVATFEPKTGQGIVASFKFEAQKISRPTITTNISFNPETQAAVAGHQTELDISSSAKYVILEKKQ